MCVGLGRLNEAMATLSFDYRIKTPINKTIIITPYLENEFRDSLIKFNIDPLKFVILSDDYFDDRYDLSRWVNDNWYKQQALKLCSLDEFDSDQFLIQDSDLILLKDYEAFIDNNPNFKAESSWNDYHKVYADCVAGILGIERNLQMSLVNELMPYYKQDWKELQNHIEQVHNKNWLDAIADYKPFDDTKWFSEYELLGIWKTNQGNYTYFEYTSQPPINSWEDFYSIDWKEYGAVKFHARPLKFMTEIEAHQVVEYINETVN